MAGENLSEGFERSVTEIYPKAYDAVGRPGDLGPRREAVESIISDTARVPLLSESEFQDAINLIYDPSFSTRNWDVSVAIMSHLERFGVRDMRTLSIGGGTGSQEMFLSLKGLINKEIVVTDVTKNMLRAGREVAEYIGVENLTFVEQDGQNLSYHDEFDQVLSIDALHWMRRWKDVIKGIERALRPGGRAFICYGIDNDARAIIPLLDLIAEATKLGLDIDASSTEVRLHGSFPRGIVHMTKPVEATRRLIVPVSYAGFVQECEGESLIRRLLGLGEDSSF